MDGDGKGDAAVQVVHWNGIVDSRLCIISTRTGLPLWCAGAPFATNFGYYAVAGNFDGDGLPDVVTVGSMQYPHGRINTYDHFGQLRHSVVLGSNGFAAIAGLGKVGDVDGDGCDEIVVGHYGPTAAGHVKLISGRTGAILQSVIGSQPSDNLGHAPTGVGDMDGDGIPDFCAGTIGSHLLMVFSGATGAVIHEFRDPTGGSAGGWAQIGGRDLDLDGVPDLVTSASGSFNGPNWTGRINAYSGRDGYLLWTKLSDPGHGTLTAYGDSLADLGLWPGSPYPVFAHDEPGYQNWGVGDGRIQVLRTNQPGAGTQIGTACSDGRLEPTIGLRTSPAGMRLSIAGAPGGGFGMLVVGSSITSYLGAPLPHALDPYGLSGCALLVAPEIMTTRILGTTGRDTGYAHVDFPGVPVAGGGQLWYAQWVVLAPQWNHLSFAATPAQEFRLQ